VGFIGLRETQDDEWLCRIQGIGIQFFGVAITWWWLCIGANLFVTVVIRADEPEKYNRYYHIAGWGVPFISTVVPLIANKYGHSNPVWCWIENDRYHIWQFGALFGHMAGCSIVGMIMWFWVIYKARQLHLEAVIRNERHFLKPFLIRHILFAILFVSVFLILVINRIYQAVKDDVNYQILLASTIVLTGQGCITFLAFGTSRKIFRNWKELIGRLFRRGNALYKRISGRADEIEEEEILYEEASRPGPSDTVRYV